MTSINRNIPTRTNYVPTTTKQPTSTNTTVTGGVSGTAVPTPTSVVMYTASAPKTTNVNNDKLAKLREEIAEVSCYLEKVQELYEKKEREYERYEKYTYKPMRKTLEENYYRGIITKDEYAKALTPFADKLYKLLSEKVALRTEVHNAEKKLEQLEKQLTDAAVKVLDEELNEWKKSWNTPTSTPTATSTTVTTPPTTTPNPMYPTGT